MSWLWDILTDYRAILWFILGFNLAYWWLRPSRRRISRQLTQMHDDYEATQRDTERRYAQRSRDLQRRIVREVEELRQRVYQLALLDDMAAIRAELGPPEEPVTELIDPNDCTQEELQAIKGIGPAISQAIIHGRPWETVDELVSVDGISRNMLQQVLRHRLHIRHRPDNNSNRRYRGVRVRRRARHANIQTDPVDAGPGPAAE